MLAIPVITVAQAMVGPTAFGDRPRAAQLKQTTPAEIGRAGEGKEIRD
jgi:hypothetical protein